MSPRAATASRARRRELLTILQERAASSAWTRFRTEAPPSLRRRPRHRRRRRQQPRSARSTPRLPPVARARRASSCGSAPTALRRVHVLLRSTEHGLFQVHAYPFSDATSTFIVETARRRGARRARSRDDRGEHRVLRGAVRRRARRPPAPREQLAVARLPDRAQRVLAPRERRADRRRGAHRALLDRLGHEARDGGRDRARGRSASTQDDVPAALAAYEEERRPIVESTPARRARQPQWFESIERYVHEPLLMFAFNLLTRSRRITYDNLQLRDPGFVARVDARARRPAAAADVHAVPAARARLANRVVVRRCACIRARRHAGRLHLVHLGARAHGRRRRS